MTSIVNQRAGAYPHVRWLDLGGNGVMKECAIMKEDGIGNIYYIEIGSMDNIDKGRLVKILTNRNSQSFELWDLMSQMTLNNGVNALTYFHQLVKVITPAGVIMSPKGGVIGTSQQNVAQQNAQTQNAYMQPGAAPVQPQQTVYAGVPNQVAPPPAPAAPVAEAQAPVVESVAVEDPLAKPTRSRVRKPAVKK